MPGPRHASPCRARVDERLRPVVQLQRGGELLLTRGDVEIRSGATQPHARVCSMAGGACVRLLAKNWIVHAQSALAGVERHAPINGLRDRVARLSRTCGRRDATTIEFWLKI